VDVAIEAGADSIEHGNWADADAVREMAARGIAWVPTLCTVMERYLEQIPPARFLVERQLATLPLAASLGLVVLAGTDEEPHGSVAREVAALIRYGLPPADAVAAATTAAHSFFGVDAGSRSVAFDTDPVVDPATLSRPVEVIA
jgi:imidazolonepropionase-like amidohydrolase